MKEHTKMANDSVLIRDILQAKKEYRQIEERKQELNQAFKMLTVICGIPQEITMKINCKDFLDGYLVANGHGQNITGEN